MYIRKLFSRSIPIDPKDAAKGGRGMSLGFRVWPGDLDVMMHMTNTRYLDLFELNASRLHKFSAAECSTVWANIEVFSQLKVFQKARTEAFVSGLEDGLVSIRHTLYRGKKLTARGDQILKIYSGPMDPVNRHDIAAGFSVDADRLSGFSDEHTEWLKEHGPGVIIRDQSGAVSDQSDTNGRSPN